MKTLTLNVIKKNRKYFACKTASGHKARLIIDDNSKDLPLGEQELPVNDCSKRTKYGTDLIFELAADAETIAEAGIVTLEHFMYNFDLVEQCKSLGGKWDSEEKCWVFSDIVADKVDELDDLYNSELISIEITNVCNWNGKPDTIGEHTGPVYFLGYMLARARGRDSGAELGDNISLIRGGVRSGGSVKNWYTIIEEETVLRLKVPKKLLDIHMTENGILWDEWKVETL